MQQEVNETLEELLGPELLELAVVKKNFHFLESTLRSLHHLPSLSLP